ncbi:MAG: glycoside hydrolase family 97 protein [Candidatus Marinimicrobia bacterium]|nr:glycoside hydrolase family 97 protein [Candidatus Neomarinimicrobiota bacterium]
MNFKTITVLLVFGLLLQSCMNISCVHSASSPSKEITVKVKMVDAKPVYCILKNNRLIIGESGLGFEIKGMGKIFDQYKLISAQTSGFDENWTQIWGENKNIRNHYTELALSLKSKENKKYGLDIIFKVYDDGVGFRYIVTGKEGDSLFVESENSEFNFIDEYTTWWIPNNYDSYELAYENTALNDVKAVNTPITMKSQNDGHHIAIHEANLTNYAEMTLEKTEKGLISVLVPWPDGIKVKATYPMITPWRTIQITDNAAGLVESNLILNLNEPNKLDDTSWITTGKYVGIWWGMHVNKNTWEQGPIHGATTENAKKYIDFASKHDITGLLIEGWNLGWEGWTTERNLNYTTPYDDIDYEEVARYGKSKGVNIIGHHETAANVLNYESQMEEAFQYLQKLGIPAVKTGYVGPINPEGQHHHGQYMVNHYRKVVEMGRKYKIMIVAHEPIKPTGLRRTYPHMMSREGAKGMEYNAWSSGNPPDHTVILPFTRLLGGPMDYTPGIFDLEFKYKPNFRVYTTLAKQLSYYINLYSPWQMAADLIENYEGHPAFEFIDLVKTSFDESRVLAAEVGDYLIIARRNGKEWFLGVTTDEHTRNFDINLDFLDNHKKYVAHIFCDAINTNWKDRPTEIEIRKYVVNNQNQLKAVVSPSGGMAIHFREYKAGNYPNIAEFNSTDSERMEAFKKVPVYKDYESAIAK